MSLLEAFGWAGSLLVVVSLTLANAVRFRVLNLAGCLIATAYNVVLDIWARWPVRFRDGRCTP